MKELSSEDEEEEEKDDDGELQGLLIKKKRRNKSMREREREATNDEIFSTYNQCNKQAKQHQERKQSAALVFSPEATTSFCNDHKP